MTPGQKIGSWTCIGPCETPKFRQPGKYVRVRCDCGVERPVLVREIIAGNSRGCGCVNRRNWRRAIKAQIIEVASNARARRGK